MFWMGSKGLFFLGGGGGKIHPKCQNDVQNPCELLGNIDHLQLVHLKLDSRQIS